MSEPLFDPGVKLTRRQELAHAMLSGDGATALQVGIELHLARGCAWCRPGRPCDYAESSGREVLTALRRKGLAVRRRSGLWQQTRPREGLGQ